MMGLIFKHTWQWLEKPSPHTGEVKTRTSRIKKGDQFWGRLMVPDTPIVYVYHLSESGMDEIKERLIWRVGDSYAAQPGRGKHAIGRVKVLKIEEQDVRCINESEARAEGFASVGDFLAVWVKMHDKKAYARWEVLGRDISYLLKRDSANYQAWVLWFEFIPKPEDTFREGWAQVKAGKTKPIGGLWEDVNDGR